MLEGMNEQEQASQGQEVLFGGGQAQVRAKAAAARRRQAQRGS